MFVILTPFHSLHSQSAKTPPPLLPPLAERSQCKENSDTHRAPLHAGFGHKAAIGRHRVDGISARGCLPNVHNATPPFDSFENRALIA